MDGKVEKIIGVTHELVNRHGYRKVTMSDIAEAADISRPTLYAAFPNKEAIMVALIERHTDACGIESARRMVAQKTLKGQLRVLFDVWVVEPFESAADNPHGRDLMDNIGTYIPDGIRAFYVRFEKELLAVLAPAMRGKRALSAADLAHLLALAARGLKVSGASIPELRRLMDGLIAMALATAE
jgi:AcrR family transcriptional regulator